VCKICGKLINILLSQTGRCIVTKKIVILVAAVSLLLMRFFSATASGHEDSEPASVGLVEKTGQKVPLDMTFFDEDGRTVTLRELMSKPTILTPVYYSCTDMCPLMLSALAASLGQVALVPGKDYKVLTISFDKNDTPAVSKGKKANYLKAAGVTFPSDSWRFLTGTQDNIDKLTRAVGFSYRKEAEGFAHPTVLIFLANDGTIIRYIYYGQSHYSTTSYFLPVDLTTAINDAARGRVRTWSINPIRWCFPGISREQEIFYTVLSIVGVLTLTGLALFFVYLKKTEGKGRSSDKGRMTGS
jgi:protein SCO1/2